MTAPMCERCGQRPARYRACPAGATYREPGPFQPVVRTRHDAVRLSVCHGCLGTIRGEHPHASWFLRWGSSTA